MKVDRAMKREIMEMVHNTFASDPLASRKDVCQAVMREMDLDRPDLMQRAEQVSVEHMLETIVGEYVRRSRARIKDSVISGQTDAGADGPPPYEAIAKVMLTIPTSGGEFETKPALLCDREDIRAARLYYAEQRESIDKRERYCAAIEQVMDEREFSPYQTVRELYAA